MMTTPRGAKGLAIAAAVLIFDGLVVLNLLGIVASPSWAGPAFTPYGDGQACVMNSECASTFCVDKVCCNTQCTAPDDACNLPGFVGTCTRLQRAPAISWQLQVVMVGLLTFLAWRRLSRG
jgi:hypothetical protein